MNNPSWRKKKHTPHILPQSDKANTNSKYDKLVIVGKGSRQGMQQRCSKEVKMDQKKRDPGKP